MRDPPPLKPLFVEGSNPPSAKRLEILAPNRWRVRPWIEEPEGTRVGIYGFRCDLLVRNRVARTQNLELEVSWHHDPRKVRKYLDFLHIEIAPDRWHLVQGKILGATVRFALRVPPGDHWLSVNPAWHVSHHMRWLESLPRRARVRTFGVTKGGRPMQEIVLGHPRRPTLGVIARCHPYESASSVKAVGIVEWLLGGSSAARRILRRWRVRIIPMANPDGVALGCARLTRPGGVDLNIEFFQPSDPTARAIERWIHEARPRLLLNLHNWMAKDLNGLYYREERDRRAFLRAFGRKLPGRRKWLALVMGGDFKPGDPPRQILDRLARDRYGALNFIVEFPWYRWSPAVMRREGARAFRAAVKVLDLRERPSPRLPNPRISSIFREQPSSSSLEDRRGGSCRDFRLLTRRV